MQDHSSVLVTGGAGFIGGHFVDRLLAEGLDVVVLDNLHAGRLENLERHLGNKSLHFVEGDVRDSRLLRKLMDVDAVFHLAAVVSVQESIKNPILTNDVNVNGTLNLLELARSSDVSRFVYASSCAVYGDAEKMPVKEDFSLKPRSPYAISKLAAENYVRTYCELYGLKTVCLRYFNVYGSRQIHSDYSGVITQFLNRLEKNLSLVVFGNGEQTRDFVHVRDVVEANLLALEGIGIAGKIFNIGSGVATTINQLVNILSGLTDKTHLRIIHSKPRKGDIQHSVADISKSKKMLHYAPKVTLKDGLEALVEAME